MPRRSGRQPATELEHCVLAVLAREGPATAYRIRNFLGISLSSYWSGSAGAIYPLLERLVASGAVRTEETPFGTRTRRRYSLTRRGRTLVRKWLAAPVAEAVVAHTYDPVRTRVFFLDLVDADAARDYVTSAIAGTERAVARHRAELGETPDLSPIERIGRRGAIRELEARLGWLREIVSEVGSRA